MLRVRHEKTRRPASSRRSCWAMTIPLPSPTGSLPITVMRPRRSSPTGGLRIQRRASTPRRLVCGQAALASESSRVQIAKIMASGAPLSTGQPGEKAAMKASRALASTARVPSETT
ncbi:hypothetical protein CC_0216 [Caulobacter vibrioides CB15]|uniref:Uncharacterized protein n=1 Tax=Caulobacter vibrioides (strain ATCC 19089 / CIP 103742 / CB 15) TaxID=190650 RepID=Q9ABL1_CAUVC|nr:hypothetical protein CC_0216 [Caulobacter vibrioides CB15]